MTKPLRICKTPGCGREGTLLGRLEINGERYHLGYFCCPEERELARRAKRRELARPVPVSPALAASTPATGYIYFVQFGDEESPVKIGWAKDPAKRIATLATGNVHAPSLRALIPGSIELERLLHKRYAAHKINGEFFERAVLDLLREHLAIERNVSAPSARGPQTRSLSGT